MLPFEFLVCPVCASKMDLSGSLICTSGHCFDYSENYINLLGKPYKGLYSGAELFKARRQIFSAGFFTPLISIVSEYITPGMVFDAGCGEGSFLHILSGLVPAQYIGLDISKPAVKLAAKQNKEILFCVGDLCRLPIKSASCAVLLNVLAPANYDEFSRILQPGGILIKIIPGELYLQELRDLTQIEKGDSNVARHFREKFQLQKRHVKYTVDCGEFAGQFISMTPLTTHRQIETSLLKTITMDFEILIGSAIL